MGWTDNPELQEPFNSKAVCKSWSSSKSLSCHRSLCSLYLLCANGCRLLLQLGKVYGIESYVLSPAETKDLYPLMNVEDLYGTLYVPKDGTMDPAGTCSTLARAATARGVTVNHWALWLCGLGLYICEPVGC